jgi:PAS domain S-box-containing protein
VCFPNTADRSPTIRPLWKQSQLVPIGHALAGGSGVLTNVVDTRGKLVVAAYRRLPSSQLGVVLKVDAQELYAPISHRLKHMLPLLLALIAGGVFLLRAHVTPLIRQIVCSEQRALAAIRDLMRGERQTRAIVDGVSDAIITMDQSGVINSFNPAAARIFGYEAPEVIGQTLKVLLTPESYKRHNADLLRFASDADRNGPGVGSVELEARSKQGTAIDVELTVNEIRAGEGRFFVAVLRDVSGRRRTERLKNEFVATVSHELRTPLTSIRGSLGLIAGGVLGPVPPEVQRLVGIAHDNSERLVRLINDILDIEKIEAGRMQFRFDAVELKGLVRRTIDATLGYAEQFGVSFELESEFVSAGVVVDADRIHQVLSNLLSNAVKYSPRGGKVRVALRARHELVRVSVSDDGPGIPETFHEHIFGKFSQADASDSRAKGGSGLGLSIAKAIVDRHGGEIGFESEVGRGTTFHVDLPGCPWPKARPRRESSSSSFRRVLFSAPRILHVEHDEQSREVVATMLEPIAHVVGAPSLAAARRVLTSERFDMVLLDLKLGDGAGQTLLDELERAPGSHPKIVIFTAHEAELDANVISRVDQIFVKARISEEQFQTAILELLRERSDRQSAVS